MWRWALFHYTHLRKSVNLLLSYLYTWKTKYEKCIAPSFIKGWGQYLLYKLPRNLFSFKSKYFLLSTQSLLQDGQSEVNMYTHFARLELKQTQPEKKKPYFFFFFQIFASDQCLRPCACPVKNMSAAEDRMCKTSKENLKSELLLKIVWVCQDLIWH